VQTGSRDNRQTACDDRATVVEFGKNIRAAAPPAAAAQRDASGQTPNRCDGA
jgi:hypothetical protein